MQQAHWSVGGGGDGTSGGAVRGRDNHRLSKERNTASSNSNLIFFNIQILM